MLMIMLSLPPALHSAAIAQPVSLIDDGGFEGRPVNLVLSPGAGFDDEVAHSGRRSLRIDVTPRPGAKTSGSARWTVEDFERGSTYTISVWVRAQEIVPNEPGKGYGYVAMYQYDRFGDYVQYHDFVQPTGSTDWERHTYTFTVQDDTTRLEIPFGLFQASGKLWVDDFTLVEGNQAADIHDVAQPTPVAEGGKPGIAILSDDLPAVGAGSDPAYLKEILDGTPGQPYDVQLLSVEELADRKVLSPRRFDMVILPYGETFPAKAAPAFRRFLRGGGDMITMGGYALNNLVGLEQPEAAEPPPQESSWHYRIPVEPEMGRTLTFRGNLRCRSVTGAGFAYLAVYQYDADEKLVTFKDTLQLRGDRDWTSSTYGFAVVGETATIDIKVGLFRCTGTASFDEISLQDQDGRELVNDTGFENVSDPDERKPHHWYRTQPELASLVTTVPLAGSQCAKVKLAAAEDEPLIMNTARGQPGDSLKIGPEQIGVFDASFPLKRVDHAQAAPDQFVLPDDFLVDSPLEGWSATTVLGHDEARRVPLLEAYDGYKRLRGSVGSITYRYAGHYAQSSWAIFGTDNFDLFPRGAPAGPELLRPLVEALVTETFLHNLTTNYACYRQGEAVDVSLKVSNFGHEAQEVAVELKAYPNDGDYGMPLETVRAHVEPGETQEFSAQWKPERFDVSFYRVEADLKLGDRPWDRASTGFVVWDEEIVKSGPDCVLQDNLFRLNGREHFLQGCDSFSFAFYSAHENPLVWARDFSTMQAQGMNLAENLQVSAVSQSPPYAWPEDLLRQTDAMVQLCQEYGLVYMPGLLIGGNVVAEDDVLEKEAAWVQAFVKRYRDVPGILWYINGDFRLQLGDIVSLAEERGGDVPRTDIERLWNEFLQRKYASDDEWKAAWTETRATGTLGKVPFEDYGAESWDDMRAVDLAAFKVELMRRWINRHVRAIREVDQHHAITSEYYRSPSPGIDIVWAIGDHDCANIGYFDRPGDDIARFPASMRFADLRARGKSMSAGEFGCKTHPAWGDGKDYGYHITRTDEQQEELWLAITHYGWGLGASKIHNWDWKDNVEWVFPWGMVYPGDWVKKDCLDVYRAAGLVFRQFERRYEEPSVYVLTPDTHRLGWPVWRVFEATLSAFHSLQYHGVQMGTLNECALGEIPESAKVIFYPIPYQIPDGVYAKLLAWVKDGGTLYVSGDVSYDINRRRTKTERLRELCGVELVQERYPNIQLSADSQVRYTFAKQWEDVNPAIEVRPSGAEVLEEVGGLPLLLRHSLGKGQVFFSTWPCELDGEFGDKAARRNRIIYGPVLSKSGVHRGPRQVAHSLPITTPLRRGGHGDIHVNPTDTALTARPSSGERPISIIAPNRSALAVRGAKGALLALEDGRHAHFMAYSLDRGDVRQSKRLCILPLTEGEVRLSTEAAWDEPVAAVGEVLGGRWIEYESFDLRPRGRSLRIPIDQERCFSIIIVAERGQVEGCSKMLVRSLTEPWRLPPKG